MEEAQLLKTKAMRENEERRYAKNFRYSLIRIRFPDGLYLQVNNRLFMPSYSIAIIFVRRQQGTFGANERLSTVFDFVQSALQHESAEFSLVSPDGQKFSNEDVDQSLVALR